MKKSKYLSKKIIGCLLAAAILVMGMLIMAGCASQENREYTPSDTEENYAEENPGVPGQDGTQPEEEPDPATEPTTLLVTGENIAEFVILGEYLGIEIPVEEITPVEESEIDLWMENILRSFAEFEEVTDRPVELGDTVLIDFAGYRDGVAFDGGTAEGFELEIGSGRFIPGFEEQIIGHNPGDQFDIDIAFPDDYHHPELAGVDVVFSINLHVIFFPTLPELTDELIYENFEIETVEEYRALVRQFLEEDRAAERRSPGPADVWQVVLDNATIIKVPEDEVELMISGPIAEITRIAEAQGITADELVGQYYPGMQLQDFIDEELRPSAIAEVEQHLVARAIAFQENITLTEEEFEETINNILELFGYESREELFEFYSEHSIRMSLLMEKVLNFVLEHARI